MSFESKSEEFKIVDPIVEAFPFMMEAANQHCHPTSDGGNGCFAYHRLWAYRRLLRPRAPTLPDVEHRVKWFRDLALEGESNKVLVAGTADYRLYAQVLHAFRLVGIEPDVTVLDMCGAPLDINRWYAKNNNSVIRTVTSNIFAYATDEQYDAITTDLFLHRIPLKQHVKLLQLWKGLLRIGGKIITREFACPTNVPRDQAKNVGRQKAPLSSFIAHADREQLINLGITREQLYEYAQSYAISASEHEAGPLDELRKAFEDCGFRIEELSLAKPDKLAEAIEQDASRVMYNITASRLS